MSNVKNAILQKKIEGVVYDLLVKTSAQQVQMGDGRSLAAFMADYITTNEVDVKLQELIGTAPEALDTLEEIAAKLQGNDDLHEILVDGLTNKVNKVEGKGLSANDFTDELRNKLVALQEYTHPLVHSADMIAETEDKQFVTSEEKIKIAESGRILAGTITPADLTEYDLFLQIVE